MKTRKGSIWLAVAAAMLLPTKAKARGRADTSVHRDDSVQKQSRRRAERGPQTLRPVASPDGRHVAEVIGGAVYVDGKRVRVSDGNVYVLAPPIWRRDGRAVAWIERSNGEARVVVIDGVGDRVAPLPLALPAVPGWPVGPPGAQAESARASVKQAADRARRIMGGSL